jgi:SAM-dependent methyltransferase
MLLIMRRSLSNKIRFVLDECIPPVVRDSRWFMYPVFFVYFRGKIPSGYMDFKTLSLKMTDEEIEKFYADIGYYGRGRETDTSEKNIEYIFKKFKEAGQEQATLLDVGCGGGDFLRRAEKQGYMVAGCDIMNTPGTEMFKYKKCNAERLTFPDQSFAVVTCLHTFEHVRDIQAAATELKRVAQKLVVVVVPCQRYYRYTVDLHLHFFPSAASLINLMGLKEYSCINIGGDLVYVGRVASE